LPNKVAALKNPALLLASSGAYWRKFPENLCSIFTPGEEHGMRDINELLKVKEAELQQLQKEIEALRLVMRMLAEPERPVEVVKAGAMAPVAEAVPPRAVLQVPAAGQQAGYSAAWDKTPRQFP
jgi:hypothetical protein